MNEDKYCTNIFVPRICFPSPHATKPHFESGLASRGRRYSNLHLICAATKSQSGYRLFRGLTGLGFASLNLKPIRWALSNEDFRSAIPTMYYCMTAFPTLSIVKSEKWIKAIELRARRNRPLLDYQLPTYLVSIGATLS
jgi:hypothetical protein